MIIRDPDSSIALIEEQENGNAAIPETYPNALSVDTTQIPNYKNYVFTITKGTLTIPCERRNFYKCERTFFLLLH